MRPTGRVSLCNSCSILTIVQDELKPELLRQALPPCWMLLLARLRRAPPSTNSSAGPFIPALLGVGLVNARMQAVRQRPSSDTDVSSLKQHPAVRRSRHGYVPSKQPQRWPSVS